MTPLHSTEKRRLNGKFNIATQPKPEKLTPPENASEEPLIRRMLHFMRSNGLTSDAFAELCRLPAKQIQKYITDGAVHLSKDAAVIESVVAGRTSSDVHHRKAGMVTAGEANRAKMARLAKSQSGLRSELAKRLDDIGAYPGCAGIAIGVHPDTVRLFLNGSAATSGTEAKFRLFLSREWRMDCFGRLTEIDPDAHKSQPKPEPVSNPHDHPIDDADASAANARVEALEMNLDRLASLVVEMVEALRDQPAAQYQAPRPWYRRIIGL